MGWNGIRCQMGQMAVLFLIVDHSHCPCLSVLPSISSIQVSIARIEAVLSPVNRLFHSSEI